MILSVLMLFNVAHLYFTLCTWGARVVVHFRCLRVVCDLRSDDGKLAETPLFLLNCAGLVLLFLWFFRSNDFRGWILRFRPQIFLVKSEKLAPNLENVRQTSVWQTVSKFWFICLFYSSCKSPKSQNSTSNVILNDLKNGTTKHFENSLKSMHFLQRLMGGMNRR